MGLLSHDFKEYGQDLNVLEGYRATMALGLEVAGDLSKERALEVVEAAIAKANVNDVVLSFTRKDRKEVRTISKLPLLNFLDRVAASDHFMAPTLTTFCPPNIKKSLVVGEIINTMARRKVVKKEAQIADQAGEVTKATIGKGLQNAIKIGVNSWSGAGLSPYNPFYSKSLHPSLTTMCRISTAIATSIVERVLAGTRYYFTPHKVIEDLLYTMQEMNNDAIIRLKSVVDLYVPTVDDVLDVIKYSTELYWWEDSKRVFYTKIVNKMTDNERMAFVYSLDFYHLYKYNPEFVSKFIGDITETDGTKLPISKMWAMDDLGGDQTNFVSGLVGPVIKGTPIWDNLAEGAEHRDYINSVAVNVLDKLDQFAPIADAFYKVKTLPIDPGKQDNAIRRTVPAGDTDSTIFSSLHINKMFYGKTDYDAKQNPVTEFCIFLVNGAIEHGLGAFTGQMNVQPDVRTKLVMKSEFNIPAMMLTNVAKTYHGIISSVEGMVHNKPKFELKGARFHAGRGNMTLVKKLHEWMNNNLIKLTKGELIDRGELVDMIHDVEQDIDASIRRKENVYFSRMRIKTLAEYKKPQSQEYSKAVFYNEVFGSEYGKGPDNEVYGCYKIPLEFNHGVEAWFNTLSKTQQAGYMRYLKYVDKDFKMIPTYVIIPIDSLHRFGLPPALWPVVNVSKVIKASLDPHYLQLGAYNMVMNYPNMNRTISDFLTNDPE